MKFVIPKKYVPMLLALASAKPKVRTLILKSLDEGTIHVLSQLAANIVHGNIPLSTRDRRKIRKFKRVISFLQDKYTPSTVKRDALIQQGGFLPLLLPIVSSIAGALISKAVS